MAEFYDRYIYIYTTSEEIQKIKATICYLPRSEEKIILWTMPPAKLFETPSNYVKCIKIQ